MVWHRRPLYVHDIQQPGLWGCINSPETFKNFQKAFELLLCTGRHVKCDYWDHRCLFAFATQGGFALGAYFTFEFVSGEFDDLGYRLA